MGADMARFVFRRAHTGPVELEADISALSRLTKLPALASKFEERGRQETWRVGCCYNSFLSFILALQYKGSHIVAASSERTRTPPGFGRPESSCHSPAKHLTLEGRIYC